MKLKVMHFPQIPCKSFDVPVSTVQEGVLVMNTLADYDLFQFENKVKCDYANAGGLNIYEDGEWVDWSTEDGDGIDDMINKHYPNGGMVKK
jgi:hypothetical protein